LDFYKIPNLCAAFVLKYNQVSGRASACVF
jgi:hypothetical protein